MTRKPRKQKPQGRMAHQGKVCKVGQSWGTEEVSASLVSTHEVIKIPTGPKRCTCNRPKNEIRYDDHSVPICRKCGLSYEPRLRDHVPVRTKRNMHQIMRSVH